MKTIIVAGIYRSGSTWQFNAIRMILKHAGKRFNQHNIYSPEFSILVEDPEYVIFKLHEYLPYYAENADYVFTSFRNPDEILPSYRRCFPEQQVDEAWLLKAKQDYTKWSAISNYDMPYADMLADKRSVIRKIATALMLEVNIEEVLTELSSLEPPANGYDPVTCYFENHIHSMKRRKFKIYYRQHVLFAAENLARNLSAVGYDAELVTWVNPDDDAVYIIYCAFCVEKLPKHYIIYQTEVPGSKWFSDSYRDALNGAIAIWDYAYDNTYSYASLNKPTYVVSPGVRQFTFAKAGRDIPVLFYGGLNDRRKKTLEAISKLAINKFQEVKIVENVYGQEMYDLLCRTQVVLNLHFYPHAPLEAFRINECLSLGCHVISETGARPEEQQKYLNQVFFADSIQDIAICLQKALSSRAEYDLSSLDNLRELKNALLTYKHPE